MIWENWVIDGSLSEPEGDLFCFVPVEGNIKGKCKFVTGMNILSDKSPGKLVGVIHLEGEQAADKFYEQHKEKIDKLL